LATLETGQAREVIHKGDVVVVPLRGEISPSLLMFLRRAEKVAESSGASAIVFEMNTYGGRVDSAEEITSALNHATIPTYTFINKEKEVKIGDRVIHPKGTLLTLNAQEATEKFNGKPLLADGIVDSVVDLMQKAGLKGKAVSLGPTGFEQLAFWITALAPLLLLGGIIGAYIEFKIPGATMPGIISAICFALFFLGHYLAGLAGWEVVALFILGTVLVIIEILFFAHSTIVFGVVGVFLIL